MIHYFNAGGIFMWVILLASICGFAVILEKLFIFLTSEKNFTEEYKEKLYRVLKNGKKKDILDLCKNKNDTISKLVVNTVENSDINFDEIEHLNKQCIEEIITANILEQTIKLEKGMWLLGAVVNTAPQLGLLGTVTGMIMSFSALNTGGVENIGAVASGISEALYTTAFGLMVAIPFLIFYNFFNKKIDHVVLEMEKVCLHFLNRLQNIHNGK
ncbi:MotA/TolQ/ExbB proton channel family protein [Leptotrichia sp. OH3620_COT-345]|nr:MotA/TolQ/ExbB proton channel family protein [Leptotrichia sp. OH3620_COT-345]